MKTDVDTCLKDIANWYVENRRELLQPELDGILLRHCQNEAEMVKFTKFLETKPGTARFKTLLRERLAEAVPKTRISSLGFLEVEMPVARAVEATARENPASSGFHVTLNDRWTIVYQGEISNELAVAAMMAGLEVSYREAPKGSGQMLTEVSLPGVKVVEIERATSVFNRFAELYGEPSELRETAQQVEVWYWKDAKYLAGDVPTADDLKRDYAVMWRGTQVGGPQEVAERMFQELNLRPEVYFSQADVKEKLQPHPHTSMSVGDIVVVNGRKFLCQSTGWMEMGAPEAQREAWQMTKTEFKQAIKWGAEPAAAIPGEPQEFFGADEYLQNAIAVLAESDKGEYYITRRDGSHVLNPPSGSMFFPDRASAWAEYHKKTLEWALADGKPVPPAVVNEYPDVLKRYPWASPGPTPHYDTYLSRFTQNATVVWVAIHNEQSLNVPGTREQAEKVLERYKLKPLAVWDGDKGVFLPLRAHPEEPSLLSEPTGAEAATVAKKGSRVENFDKSLQGTIDKILSPNTWVIKWDNGTTSVEYPSAVDLLEPGGRKPSLLYEPETCEVVSSRYYDLLPFLDSVPSASLQLEPSTKERKIDDVLEKLKQGVQSIQSSAVFREFLITMSKFHNYSIGNQILIMLQRPTATRVAGFNAWKGLERTVMAGEKGIMILAPCVGAPRYMCPLCPQGPFTEAVLKKHVRESHPGGDVELIVARVKGQTEEEVATYFKVVYVFDVSQTKGKPLPEVEVPALTGDANEELFAKVMKLLQQQGVSVSFESRPDQDPEIKGMYIGRSIWVRPEESRAQMLKTSLHETGHYYTESVFGIPRADAETIAESVAFAVGAHFGFDSGLRSFPYVAVWSQDKKVLDRNLDTIRKVVTSMLDSLEGISA